jgi:hypothetical protein
MPESGLSGSVRGAVSNHRPYRDPRSHAGRGGRNKLAPGELAAFRGEC